MGNSGRDKKNTLIIHAITRLDLGGAQKIVLSLLTHLKKRGYNVLLICGEGGELFPEFKNKNIDMHIIKELKREINPIYDLLAIINTTRLLNRLRKENQNIIVHTHTPKAGIIVRLSAHFAGIRNIYHTIHGWGFHKGQNPISYFIFVLIEKITSGITTKLIAVSEYVKNIGIKYGIGKKNQYTIIRNGIKTKPRETRISSIYKDLGIPRSKRIILQVSSLKPAKSPMDFLRIAKRFTQRDDLIFIIAGGGELKKGLQSYINKNNLNNTILLGWYENVSNLYSIADVCILTSISEGMPLAIMEAMSFKIPIVASNIEPIREILPGYEYLCLPHDIDCFVKKINKLLLSRNFNPHYNKYGENEMLREYENLYI